MKNKADNLLLPALKKIQKRDGFISEDSVKALSIETKIPVSRIFGVITFYSMLHTKKQGKHIIYICSSPSCAVNGSLDIFKYLEKKLKIKAGSTTKDKKFTLYETSCIGCCDEPPAMLLNGKSHTKLTETKIDQIIKKCRS
ncbi:MAG: NAD(P)H-dependent oxidoreductase subunit E [Pseudomonadota bacterium]